jgi:hypothetical protein
LADFRAGYDPDVINLFRVSLVKNNRGGELKNMGHVQMAISDIYDLKLQKLEINYTGLDCLSSHQIYIM